MDDAPDAQMDNATAGRRVRKYGKRKRDESKAGKITKQFKQNDGSSQRHTFEQPIPATPIVQQQEQLPSWQSTLNPFNYAPLKYIKRFIKGKRKLAPEPNASTTTTNGANVLSSTTHSSYVPALLLPPPLHVETPTASSSSSSSAQTITVSGNDYNVDTYFEKKDDGWHYKQYLNGAKAGSLVRKDAILRQLQTLGQLKQQLVQTLPPAAISVDEVKALSGRIDQMGATIQQLQMQQNQQQYEQFRSRISFLALNLASIGMSLFLGGWTTSVICNIIAFACDYVLGCQWIMSHFGEKTQKLFLRIRTIVSTISAGFAVYNFVNMHIELKQTITELKQELARIMPASVNQDTLSWWQKPLYSAVRLFETIGCSVANCH